MSKGRILIVDDEKDIRFLLREILEDEGYEVAEAPHSEAAYGDIASKGMPDLVILDIWLENSDRDGMEILSDLKKRSKTLPVLMISGHGNIEMAVKAIKLGAYDFIEKPFNTDRLLHLVGRAFDTGRKRLGSAGKVDFVSVSSDMLSTLKAAQKAAGGEGRVLVTGAWGTGRTYLARFIHQESGRAGKPCVVLSSRGLEAGMLAEALAGEGSVVLRDIQNLSPALQADLLTRLNAKPEARVLATAGPELESVRAEGKFLGDLYDRLAVVQIEMPSLAMRRADMTDLCVRFIEERFARFGSAGGIRISEAAKNALFPHHFGGQAAELQAVCHRAAIAMMLEGVTEALPKHFALGGGTDAEAQSLPIEGWLEMDLRSAREQFEKWYIEQVLARFDSNVSQAAAFAGMDRTSFHRKLKSIKDGDAEAA
ncbi:MAG: sigma-54-dependent Fis family transcriptional regulator [Proteobacteria bacterium]|nr:sigma-54-dependent Fis family transcriptional regulator [Pseudomonadota bacterium]